MDVYYKDTLNPIDINIFFAIKKLTNKFKIRTDFRIIKRQLKTIEVELLFLFSTDEKILSQCYNISEKNIINRQFFGHSEFGTLHFCYADSTYKSNLDTIFTLLKRYIYSKYKVLMREQILCLSKGKNFKDNLNKQFRSTHTLRTHRIIFKNKNTKEIFEFLQEILF